MWRTPSLHCCVVQLGSLLGGGAVDAVVAAKPPLRSKCHSQIVGSLLFERHAAHPSAAHPHCAISIIANSQPIFTPVKLNKCDNKKRLFIIIFLFDISL